MNHNPALAQLKRVPVIIALTLMMLLAGLLLLEQTGPAVSAPKAARLNFVNSSSVTDQGNDFHNPGGNPVKHCTDGKGHDAEHNKHCLSGT